MYPVLLGAHSWIRWILLISILLVLLRSISGYRNARVYSAVDEQLALLLFWMLNIQFLFGLALYIFFSPYTAAAFSNLSEAISNPALRFFLIEHPLAMFLAIGAGHSGLRKAKLETDARDKHRQLIKGASGCLFFVLVGIPWPFLPYGRALFFL